MKFLKRALTSLFPANGCVKCNREEEERQQREQAARNADFLLEKKKELEAVHAQLVLHILKHNSPHNIH